MRLPVRWLFVAYILFAACSPTTKVVQSWRDPDVKLEQGHYKKLLCIVMVKDEANRRVAEDKLATLIHGAVQSYKYIGALPDTIDANKMSPRIKKDGFDGIVIMRLVRKEKDVTYVPGGYPAPYYSVWGYYGYAMPYFTDPGYIRTDDYYYIETNLYDVAKDKLIWSGITSSWEPNSVGSVVEDVMKAIHEKMVLEGFVAPPATSKK